MASWFGLGAPTASLRINPQLIADHEHAQISNKLGSHAPCNEIVFFGHSWIPERPPGLRYEIHTLPYYTCSRGGPCRCNWKTPEQQSAKKEFLGRVPASWFCSAAAVAGSGDFDKAGFFKADVLAHRVIGLCGVVAEEHARYADERWCGEEVDRWAWVSAWLLSIVCATEDHMSVGQRRAYRETLVELEKKASELYYAGDTPLAVVN